MPNTMARTRNQVVYSLLRGLLFIAFFEIYAYKLAAPIGRFVKAHTGLFPPVHGHVLPTLGLITNECISLTIAAAITLLLIMTESRVVGRRLSLSIFAAKTNLNGSRNRLSQLMFGLLLGFVGVTLIMAALIGSGVSHVSFNISGIWTTTRNLLALATAYGMVGLTEEFFFRGYAQRSLTDGLGFWGATAITSMWCMFLHNINGDPLIGAAHAGLDGVFWCMTLRATGNLAFPIGYHAAWDFTQSAVFGVPDSTYLSQGSLAVTATNGPTWLTGGVVGPEGSLLSFLLLGILMLLTVSSGAFRRMFRLEPPTP